MFSSEMLAQMIRFYGSAQQTIMGQYMEQNVKAFLAIQKKLQDQAKQVYGDKMMLTPDLWKQFMQMQAPAMQGMLGNYLEQSAKLFMDMQQRMQDQTRGMFTAFPFPNFGAPPQAAPTTTRSAEPRKRRSIARFCARVSCIALVHCRPPRKLSPASDPRRAARRLRLARLSEGAGRFRADPDAAARRGLRDRADLRRRRSRRRQHLRLHRRRGRRIARRDRRGAGRERQGHRHRLPRRQGRRRRSCATRIRRCSRSPGRTRPQEVMSAVHAHLPKPHDPFVDLVPPQGIKLTPSHYAYLKISEGCNHRCTFCIIPSMRGDLVSRPIGEVMQEAENLRQGRREGAAGRLAGHERVRRRRALPHRLLARAAGQDADDRARARARAGASSARGCGCTTSIRIRTSTTSSR